MLLLYLILFVYADIYTAARDIQDRDIDFLIGTIKGVPASPERKVEGLFREAIVSDMYGDLFGKKGDGVGTIVRRLRGEDTLSDEQKFLTVDAEFFACENRSKAVTIDLDTRNKISPLLQRLNFFVDRGGAPAVPYLQFSAVHAALQKQIEVCSSAQSALDPDIFKLCAFVGTNPEIRKACFADNHILRGMLEHDDISVTDICSLFPESEEIRMALLNVLLDRVATFSTISVAAQRKLIALVNQLDLPIFPPDVSLLCGFVLHSQSQDILPAAILVAAIREGNLKTLPILLPDEPEKIQVCFVRLLDHLEKMQYHLPPGHQQNILALARQFDVNLWQIRTPMKKLYSYSELSADFIKQAAGNELSVEMQKAFFEKGRMFFAALEREDISVEQIVAFFPKEREDARVGLYTLLEDYAYGKCVLFETGEKKLLALAAELQIDIWQLVSPAAWRKICFLKVLMTDYARYTAEKEKTDNQTKQ